MPSTTVPVVLSQSLQKMSLLGGCYFYCAAIESIWSQLTLIGQVSVTARTDMEQGWSVEVRGLLTRQEEEVLEAIKQVYSLVSCHVRVRILKADNICLKALMTKVFSVAAESLSRK